MLNLAFLSSIIFYTSQTKTKHDTVCFRISRRKYTSSSCMIKLDLALHPQFPYARSHENPPPLHSWYSLKKKSKQNQSADEIFPAQNKGLERKTLPSTNATSSGFHTMLLFNISIPESDSTAVTFYEETVFSEEHRKRLF